jgi:uncharacterized protein (TIGR02271 family)
MFHNRADAERAADTLSAEASVGATNIRVLPERDADAGTTAAQPQETGGFMAGLRNFFMPEEDRYTYAEGMRRGSYMVAADVDEAHAHRVMDILEDAGAVDLDTEETRWRSEGWRGHEPSSSAAAGSTAATSGVTGGAQATTIPPMPSSTGSAVAHGSAAASPAAMPSAAAATTLSDDTVAPAGSTLSDDTVAPTGTSGDGLGHRLAATAGSDERIPLAEETLRVGKRVAQQGRVRIRSYVVETPVTETVHLRDERVDVERRAVDRPLSGTEADPFREREIEATETREEAVVAKDVRVREELVVHKSVEEHDETVHDTVRRTEVKEERGEDVTDPSGTVRNPTTTPRGS